MEQDHDLDQGRKQELELEQKLDIFRREIEIHCISWELGHESDQRMLQRCLRYCTALHCTILYGTALRCTSLHCTALHCNILHKTALHCTAMHGNGQRCRKLKT